MRIWIALLFLPLLMACPRPTPPGPLSPQEEGEPSEVRDTAPVDEGRVKRYRADLGLRQVDGLDAIAKAWEEYEKTFSGATPRTCDHGFAEFWSFMEKNIRQADRQKGGVSPGYVSAARAGQPLDLGADDLGRSLSRNHCTLRLISEFGMAIRPDWSLLGQKAAPLVSDTLETLFEQLQREEETLEKTFRAQPEAPSPLACAENFDFWAGIHYDTGADFPLRGLVNSRYSLWLKRLLPECKAGQSISDYEKAWRTVADYWAESPEGVEFADLVEEAAAANWAWNESLAATRKALLNKLEPR